MLTMLQSAAITREDLKQHTAKALAAARRGDLAGPLTDLLNG
jgi:hypothetical protein